MNRNLSEIRAATHYLVKKWEEKLLAGEVNEKSHTGEFYRDLFDALGVGKEKAIKYEERAKGEAKGDNTKFIDIFWPTKLLVEQKSPKRSLDDAEKQALDYIPLLKHRREWPAYVLLSDFARFRLLKIADSNQGQLYPAVTERHAFTLNELPEKLDLLGFLTGYQRVSFAEQAPVNRKAAELMATLHDQLKATGYTGHNLEVFMVRLLFCLFADDTGLFRQADVLQEYIKDNTRSTGEDTGSALGSFFQALDQTEKVRQSARPEVLRTLPYVNGGLFSERLDMPYFTAKAHEQLLEACAFNWKDISPAVFGNLFQTIMRRTDENNRRQLGAEYTAEHNILKVINGLFMDDLRAEFNTIKHNTPKLKAFHEKLGTITCLDPACGCGNFLVLAYRELRLLELEVIKALHPPEKNLQINFFLSEVVNVSITQFYGFEIEEVPARIAEVAMYLVEHQMNMQLHNTYGMAEENFPLNRSAHVTLGNALELEWADHVPMDKLNYIIGNPPFVGSKMMNAKQRQDILGIFPKLKGNGILDYVTGWYGKAAQTMQAHPHIKTAFVSTNSICQGEQVGVLWGYLLGQGFHIQFAHRTFAWTSEAKGKAAVYCIIVAFGLEKPKQPMLYEYENLKGQPTAIAVKNISPYLSEGGNVVVQKTTQALCDVPPIVFGNQPIDGGNLILSPEEYQEFIKKYPQAKSLLRPYIGADELINGGLRYVLWLKNISPNTIKDIPEIIERIEKVKSFRNAAPQRVKHADKPSLFASERHPENSTYIAMPSVSSERRSYIPMAFLDSSTIASNLCLIIPNANVYHLGVLTSTMHMAWVKNVGGRLKSDYRYSNQLCYNPYPWPTPTPAQKAKIEACVQAVLDARAKHLPPNGQATLADLYNPLLMPPELLKAHKALDKAVDAAYRKAPFTTEAERIAFLLDAYQKLAEPLNAAMAKPKRKRRKKA